MSVFSPLQLSNLLLQSVGTQVHFHHRDRVIKQGPLLIVSNHRSILDAPLLMVALQRSIHFVCHHYMSQVPILRELVNQLGALPLERSRQRQQTFFEQANALFGQQQVVGVFPEGTQPMVNSPKPQELREFHRGFAHLALKAEVRDMAILPVAIAAQSELKQSLMPLQWLSVFDPSEPLFKQTGWHPLVLYQRADVLVGRPIWITPAQQQDYQGKHAKRQVLELSDRVHQEIATLLKQGFI